MIDISVDFISKTIVADIYHNEKVNLPRTDSLITPFASPEPISGICFQLKSIF